MGGTPPDLRQAARDALQHPRAADRRRARAGRLRGHRRDWHRGVEPWRVARRVRRARSPRAGADCGKPRRLRRDERLCYHPRQLRSRGGGSSAGVIRSRPAGPAVRPCARGRHRARIARAGGQRRADSRARAPAGGAGVERRAHAHTRRRLRRFRAGVLSMPTLAVYPGSFDPLTNGHVDIITRGARLFDRIIVAILVNAEKSPLFTMDERVEIARAVFAAHANVEVDTFDGLLVDSVDRLRREGVEVVDFGAGEPDFPTPPAINAAAHAAIDQGFTKYTPVAGAADLKRAICDRYRTDYGVDYKDNEVITSAGGKQALF